MRGAGPACTRYHRRSFHKPTKHNPRAEGFLLGKACGTTCFSECSESFVCGRKRVYSIFGKVCALSRCIRRIRRITCLAEGWQMDDEAFYGAAIRLVHQSRQRSSHPDSSIATIFPRLCDTRTRCHALVALRELQARQDQEGST